MLRFIDPKVDEPCAGINHLPLHNQHISYNSIHRTQDVILHFHGFKDQHQIALFNGIAGLHLDTDDPAWHWRLHVARKGQRSAGFRLKIRIATQQVAASDPKLARAEINVD